METKDILIKYGVDPGNTTKAMNDIAKASAVAGGSLDKMGVGMKTNNQLGMNFNRVLQDSPYFFSSFNMGVMSVANNLPVLAESFQQAKSRGETFKQMLSGMFTGMGGWMTALNLVISGVLAYTMATRGSKEETDGMTESMQRLNKQFDRMVTVNNPFGNIFKLDTSNITNITKLIDKIDQLTGKAQQEEAGTIPGVDSSLENAEAYNKLLQESFIKMAGMKEADKSISDGVRKRLEDLKTEIEYQRTLKRMLEEIGMTAEGNAALIKAAQADSYADLLESIDAAKKGFEDIDVDTLTKNNTSWKDARSQARMDLVNGLQEDMTDLGNEMPDIILPDVSVEEIKRRWREIHRFESHLADAAAATLRTGMNQAFDDIFGHANSLLEIFLQNMFSAMASDWASDIGSGIFSWLTGGTSSVLEGIFGSSAGGGGSRSDFVVTNVNIDGAVVAQAITPYVASQQYARSRTKR
jgi:hypothetical protein